MSNGRGDSRLTADAWRRICSVLDRLHDGPPDPRLDDDFVSTGFRGPHKSRAVKGHEFGLTLSAEDRKALIALLRTL